MYKCGILGNCKIFFLSFLLFLSIGCSSIRRAPVLVGEELSVEQKGDLLDSLDNRLNNFLHLKALGRLRIKRDGEEVTVRAALLFRQPDMLRIELFPLTNFTTLSLLVSRSGSVTLYEPQERRAYRGGSSLLAHIVGFNIDVGQFVALLTGSALVEESPQRLRAVVDPTHQNVTVMTSDQSVLWVVDLSTLAVQHAEFREVGHDQLHAETWHSEFGELKGAQIPRTIRVQSYEQDMEFALTLTTLDIDSPPREELFSLNLGGDVTVAEGD